MRPLRYTLCALQHTVLYHATRPSLSLVESATAGSAKLGLRITKPRLHRALISSGQPYLKLMLWKFQKGSLV